MSEPPHLTVAAVAIHDHRILMVEEWSGDRLVLNQPAGHVEANEGIIDAVRRETLEEAGVPFTPEALIGIYRWRSPRNGISYVRIAIAGSAPLAAPQPHDPDIVRALWLPLDAIHDPATPLRSPLVAQVVTDWQRGSRHPLTLLHDLG